MNCICVNERIYEYEVKMEKQSEKGGREGWIYRRVMTGGSHQAGSGGCGEIAGGPGRGPWNGLRLERQESVVRYLPSTAGNQLLHCILDTRLLDRHFQDTTCFKVFSTGVWGYVRCIEGGFVVVVGGWLVAGWWRRRPETIGSVAFELFPLWE